MKYKNKPCQSMRFKIFALYFHKSVYICFKVTDGGSEAQLKMYANLTLISQGTLRVNQLYWLICQFAKLI